MSRSDWTQAPRGTRLFALPIPAYASLSLLVVLFHPRLWTLLFAICLIAFLTYLHLKGRTVPWLIRRIKLMVRGGVVYARPLWYRRRTQHLGSFDLVDLKGD